MLIATLDSLAASMGSIGRRVVDSATVFYCTKLKVWFMYSIGQKATFPSAPSTCFILFSSPLLNRNFGETPLRTYLPCRGISLKLEWNSINLIFVRKRSRPVKISNNECTYFICSSPAIFWFHRRCIEYAKILKLKEEISSFSISVAILAQFTLSLLSQSRIQWLGKETSDSHTFLYNNVRPAGPRIPQPGPS